MEFITLLFILLYAALTGIAGIVQWREKGFQVRTSLFILVSIVMFSALWIPIDAVMVTLLIITFVFLHVLAILEGLQTNGKLRISHHLIRFGVHVVLVILVIQF